MHPKHDSTEAWLARQVQRTDAPLPVQRTDAIHEDAITAAELDAAHAARNQWRLDWLRDNPRPRGQTRVPPLVPGE